MLRKIRFPRMVIPLSVSLTSLFNLLMNFIAVIVFALANGITPMLSWLELIPIVLGFVMLATGIGMLLSALYVRYRDVQPIWEVVVQAWFYLSPVMYTAESAGKRLGEGFKQLALLNPVATLLTQMGHAFIDPSQLESAKDVAGGPLIPTHRPGHHPRRVRPRLVGIHARGATGGREPVGGPRSGLPARYRTVVAGPVPCICAVRARPQDDPGRAGGRPRPARKGAMLAGPSDIHVDG